MNRILSARLLIEHSFVFIVLRECQYMNIRRHNYYGTIVYMYKYKYMCIYIYIYIYVYIYIYIYIYTYTCKYTSLTLSVTSPMNHVR